jgi:hypothetical protein
MIMHNRLLRSDDKQTSEGEIAKRGNEKSRKCRKGAYIINKDCQSQAKEDNKVQVTGLPCSVETAVQSNKNKNKK